jgi:hypothetical protein
VLPGRHGHGSRPAGAGAIHVERCITNDGEVRKIDVTAHQRPDAFPCDGWESPTIRVVGAIRTDTEKREQPRGAKLGNGPPLDVAREESDKRLTTHRKRGQERCDAGQNIDAVTVRQTVFQVAHIPIEAFRQPVATVSSGFPLAAAGR